MTHTTDIQHIILPTHSPIHHLYTHAITSSSLYWVVVFLTLNTSFAIFLTRSLYSGNVYTPILQLITCADSSDFTRLEASSSRFSSPSIMTFAFISGNIGFFGMSTRTYPSSTPALCAISRLNLCSFPRSFNTFSPTWSKPT